MMTKTLKKFVFAAFSVVLVMCAFMLVACDSRKSNKPREEGKGMFKDGVKTDIYVGSCVDVDDYIIRFDDALSYTVSYSYTNKENKTVTGKIKGSTFYPTVETKYTLLYEVEELSRVLYSSIELNVYGDPPEISVTALPLAYEKGDTVSFKVLTMAANPYSETVSSFNIEKVNYRKFNVDLEETTVSGTEKETVFTDETEFTFDESGTYTFTLAGTADDKTTRVEFNVEVADKTRVNDNVLNDGSGYVMKNAEVDGDKIRLIQAEYSDASFVVMDGEYYDQDVVRIEFKGKNCPNIGFLIQPDTTAFNPYDLYTGLGFVFSMEHHYTDKFSIHGYGKGHGKGEGRFAGMNLHNGNSITGYMGRDNFEDDKYYAIELNEDSGSVESLLSVFHLRIFEISDYGKSTQSQKQVYAADVPTTDKLEAKLTTGKLVFYGSAKENVTFKYFMPITKVGNFERNGNTVTWDSADGAEYLVSTDGSTFTAQAGNSYTFEEFIPEVTPLYVKAKRPVNVLVGGASAYNLEETENYTGDEFIKSESALSLTQNKNGEAKHVNASIPFVSGAKQSYAATKDDFAAGSFAMVEFKGKAMPGRVIFGASELSETANSIVGTGLTFDDVFYNLVYHKKDASTAADISRPVANTPSANRGVYKGKVNRGYLTGLHESEYPNSAVNAGTNFILVAGADNSANGVEVTYYLYKRIGADHAELIDSGKIYQADATLTDGKIVFASTNVASTVNAYLQIHSIGAFDEVNATLKERYNTEIFVMDKVFDATTGTGAEFVSDGVLDLTCNFISGDKKNYISTKETYGSGTFTALEFKGKEYPPQVLFGVQSLSQVPDSIVGIGFDCDISVWNGAIYYKPDAATAADKNTVTAAHLSRGYFDEQRLNNGESVFKGNKEKDFVLICGATQNASGGIDLKWTLYTKANNALTKVHTETKTIANAVWKDGKICVTSSDTTHSHLTKVRYYAPDTEENLMTKLGTIYTMPNA